MAKNAYIAIRDQKLLLCQAPTGTGKTLGALFPAVKAISEGLIARAFYLTARTTARRAAEDALRLLRQNGLKLRAVTLTAKDKICFSPRTSCHPSECVFAQDYFDKRREALREALNLQALDRAAIEALAREYDVCPFELSLDLTETAEIIICDYNYVFDPHVRLKRFFGDKAIKGDYALMIDEAHNLFPRVQDMLSAQLSERSLRLVRRALKEWVGKENEVYKALSDVIRVMCRLNRELDAPECQLAPYGALHDAVAKFVAAGEGHISENEMLTEALFAAMDYLRVEQEFDDERMRVLYVTGKLSAHGRDFRRAPSRARRRFVLGHAFAHGTLRAAFGAERTRRRRAGRSALALPAGELFAHCAQSAHALFGARGNGGARGPGDLSNGARAYGQLYRLFSFLCVSGAGAGNFRGNLSAGARDRAARRNGGRRARRFSRAVFLRAAREHGGVHRDGRRICRGRGFAGRAAFRRGDCGRGHAAAEL